MGSETQRKGVSLDECIGKMATAAEIARQKAADFEKFRRIGQMVGKELRDLELNWDSSFEEYFLSRFNGKENIFEYAWRYITKPFEMMRFEMAIAQKDYSRWGPC